MTTRLRKKYERPEKTRLYRRILRYWGRHRDVSYEEIGRKYGLTRQRIGQIIKEGRDGD